MSVPLYGRLLADRYVSLPGAVQRLHDCTAPSIWSGRCSVVRGTSRVARAVASLMSLPPSTAEGETCAIHVAFSPDARGGEEWVRTFAVGPPPWPTFVSRQWGCDGRLNERVLFTRFVFDLKTQADRLELVLERCFAFGLPLPKFMHPVIATAETERDSRYHFDVEARLPLGMGLLVRYQGWLEKA